MLEILQNLDLKTLIQGLLTLVGGMAVLATMTKTPKDDGILRKIKSVLDILAMNVGKAKNTSDDIAKGTVVKKENIKALVRKDARV